MMTFRDPSAIKEFQYTEGSGMGPGSITYVALVNKPVHLIIDGTDHGLPEIDRTVDVVLTLTVGTATELAPGFGHASTDGMLSFVDKMTGQTIISGAIDGGRLIWSGTTGVELANTTENSLVWTAGAFLLGYLDFATTGLAIDGTGDFAFSLSAINPDGPGFDGLDLNESGYVESFTANAAFVGNANIVPAPAPLALAAAMGLAAFRRRSR